MCNTGFAIGTGRCGTKYLATLLAEHSDIASSHEKHPLSDTFHRYCKWHRLPVDHEGFLHNKAVSIKEDLQKADFSFESSAYLSLSVAELFDRFQSKFILLVRNPESVVNSYVKKGWYRNGVQFNDGDRIPSYQQNSQFHHFLGRTLPNTASELERWKSMSITGQLAWYWNVLNKEVIKQFRNLPETHYLIVRLEDFNYEKYREITEFLEVSTEISPAGFDAISNSKVNSFGDESSGMKWSETELMEFNRESHELRLEFEYPGVTQSSFYSH